MFITMHCGCMPFNGNTIKEKSLGGSETAAYYMAKGLAEIGHKVTIFTNSKDGGVFDGVKYVWAGEITKEFPLGKDFHIYAANTPQDVLIIQRFPEAFAYNWNSKINIWWLHDLALYRNAHIVQKHLFNIDMVFTVSEYHKKQVSKVWGINSDIIKPVQNGIDLSLFSSSSLPHLSKYIEQATNEQINADVVEKRINLLYSSRPERGLENLVLPGGIMERLAKIDHKYHLYVCMYANFPAHMKDYYQHLFDRIEALPNCTNLGCLTKQELADVMRQCDALVYPTKFEEVSCITAMEAMAAGLPFISSEHAALPDTCKGSGSYLIPLKDNKPDIDKFVERLNNMFCEKALESPNEVDTMKGLQLEAAKKYDWSVSVDIVNDYIAELYEKLSGNVVSVAKHLMQMSDIYALKYHLKNNCEGTKNRVLDFIKKELKECYKFMNSSDWSEHYKLYYEYEKKKGVKYGPEPLDGIMRYEVIKDFISDLKDGSTVLDYGCAHGHYTINLAKSFPNINFVGIDVVESNIKIAKKWMLDDDVKNVVFYTGSVDINNKKIGCDKNLKFDAIIAAEVIEHLQYYSETVDTLCGYLKDDGVFIGTTPYGPWESQGYKKEWPWRAHVHHFEKKDLHEAFGHHKDFNVLVVPYNNNLGSYVWSFKKPVEKSRHIDYERKLKETIPLQTLSLCMIVKNAESTIRKCLDSVMGLVDEVIIGIDNSTNDDTFHTIHKYLDEKWPEKPREIYFIENVVDSGFDVARNDTIKKSNCDWILWLDSDEYITDFGGLKNYLKNNMYDSYAIDQHHISAEPLGVLKTDKPCRIFRNNKGIKFYGVVHEHPEKKLNEGAGHSAMIDSIFIMHDSYTTEKIRRDKFNRNISLLVRDREKYPDRILGKFLWFRDLAQMCQQEIEFTGKVTDNVKNMVKDGLELFDDLLMYNNPRLIYDSLPYYSILSELSGDFFEFCFKIDSSKLNGKINLDMQKTVYSKFISKKHLKKVLDIFVNSKVEHYENKYF